MVPMWGLRSQAIRSLNTPLPSEVVPLRPGRCRMIFVAGPRHSGYFAESAKGPTPSKMQDTP